MVIFNNNQASTQKEP